MYAILRGKLSVHVIFDPESDKEVHGKVEAAMGKKKFNRNDFGNEVAQKGRQLVIDLYQVIFLCGRSPKLAIIDVPLNVNLFLFSYFQLEVTTFLPGINIDLLISKFRFVLSAMLIPS